MLCSASSNFLNYFRIDRGQSPVATQPNSNIDYMKIVPADVWLHVFSMIPPHEMGPIRCVCRDFRRLGSEEILGGIPALQKFYPKIKVIGPEVWNQYADCQALGIDSTGAFQPTTRALGDAIGSFYKQVEGDAGATVFTLPKGLTFNKLMTIARQHGVPERFILNRVPQQLGDEAVTATCIQVISNSVLKNSRNGLFAEQQQQALCSHLRCEAPDVVTSLALVILSYLESSDQPANRSFGVLSTKEFTYTRSPQKIDNSNLIVGVLGGSAPRGLSVNDYYYDVGAIGVMALRKF